MLSFYRGLLLGFSLIISSTIHAQILKEPATVQSPNAMSFGIFGDIPVSYYSGVPSIQVPLYTLQENQISVPINLNYHASGFRPDVHPGWVGLNWNLGVGGVITRVVRDLADDLDIGPAFPFVKGYYYTHNLNNNNDWETAGNLTIAANNFENTWPDTEPDEFSFNFSGYSGKFYMDHKGKWKVSCDQPIKVELNDNMIQTFLFDDIKDGLPHFSGFTITDEFGNKYIFGVDNDAIEYSTPFWKTVDPDWTAQAWYLTRIIHADGYEVKFKYERDNYINQMYSSFHRLSNFYAPGGSGFLDIPCTSAPSGPSTLLGSYSGKLISPVYLASIEGSNQTILFKRSNTTELKYSTVRDLLDYRNPYEYTYYNQSGPPSPIANVIQENPYNTYVIKDLYDALDRLKFKQLDTIEVQDNKGATLRRFKFYYTANTAKRLSLDSLKEIGKNNEVKPCYKFAYKPHAITGEVPYLNNTNDHYGYYNSAFGDLNNFTTYYGQRNSTSLVTQYGIIDSIIYPTGGVTKFYFRPNTYYKRVQEFAPRGIDNSYASLTFSGGLRVQKIESYDKSTPSIKKTKEYYYSTNYTNASNPETDPPSGVLGARSRYEFAGRKYPIYGGSPGSTFTEFCFSAQSVLPACENSAGTHIGYSEVTEKLSDGSYSKYFYNNYDNDHLDDSALVLQDRTPYELVSSRAIERGTLRRQEDYSSAGTMLKKKVIEYTDLNRANEYVRSVKSRIFQVCSGNTSQAYEGTAYRQYTYSYLPKSEVIVEYKQGGIDSLVTKKYLFYNDTTRLLIKDSVVSSKAQPICNYYYYPVEVLNYNPANNVPIAQTIAYMKQKNMIGNIIQTISTRKITSSEYVTGLNLTTFKDFGSLVKPYRQYNFLQPATQAVKGAGHLYRVGFSGGIETDALPANTELISTASKYDLRGNITTIGKDQNINVAYLWKHNFQLPVSKVTNAYNNLEYGVTTVPKQLVIKKPPSLYNATASFRHYAQGNIAFKLSYEGVAIPAASMTMQLNIYGPQSVYLELSAGETETLINYPPGIYNVQISNVEHTPPVPPSTLVITYNGQEAIQTSSNTSAEFFYEGFEETIYSGIKPFAGSNCNNGDYTVPYVVPPGGTYQIDYRYLESGTWNYIKKYYSNGMTITEGDAIDEVRVYRTDAQPSTFTYDRELQLTSQADANGKTERYFYDGLGRLIMIKDDEGNILKRICYNYAGQTQNCALDTSVLWQFTGDFRCKPCPLDPNYTFNIKQILKRNNNPHSASYNDTLWIDDGISAACGLYQSASWVQTATPLVCEKSGTNNNTGSRLREERDTAKCSPTYNLHRLVVHDYNASVCPITMGNLKLTSVGGLSGAYITFTGTSGTPGTHTFYFPNGPGSVTNMAFGTIPNGLYNVYFNLMGVTRTVNLNGYSVTGATGSASNILAGGPSWLITLSY